MQTHLRNVLYCSAECRIYYLASGLRCIVCRTKHEHLPFDLFLIPGGSQLYAADEAEFVKAHEKCRRDWLAANQRSLECDCADCRESKGLPRKRDARYPWIESSGRSTAYRKHFDAVATRDGWTCQICDLPVDQQALPLADKAPVLDHVRRVRDGGDDETENLRLVHRWCNAMREFGGLYRDDDEVWVLAQDRFATEDVE
jgi:5-methylcytosine-specific restriction endonuclease McrA